MPPWDRGTGVGVVRGSNGMPCGEVFALHVLVWVW